MEFREVKARAEHVCQICGGKIGAGEVYFKYIDPETEWEKSVRKAC